MSKYSTIYDTMLSRLATIFPTKKRIPNPYTIESNPAVYLDDGYGLIMGEFSQITMEWNEMSVEQTFTVVLTKKMFKVDSDPLMFDTLVKAMREDVVILQKDFYNVNRLNIPTDIDNLVLGSVGRMTEVNAGKFNILSIEVPFIVTIGENL